MVAITNKRYLIKQIYVIHFIYFKIFTIINNILNMYFVFIYSDIHSFIIYLPFFPSFEITNLMCEYTFKNVDK